MGEKAKPVGKVLVGNIPVKVDEDLIRSFFEGTASAVVKVEIPLNPKTQGHMGYAIVQFASLADATRAVEDMKGVEISGRAISCSIIETPEPPRKWYQR